MPKIKPSNPIIDWGNPITKGLVLDLPMSINTLSKTVEPTNKNIVSTVASPTIATGAYGQELVFNGTSQYINAGLMNGFGPNIGSYVTTEFIVKTSATSGGFWGFLNTGANTAFSCSFAASGQANIFIRQNGAGGDYNAKPSADTGLSNGLYHHVIMISNPNTKTLEYWQDGVNIATTVTATISQTNFSDLGFAMYIAARDNRGTADSFQSCNLSMFRMFTRALTGGEITKLFTDPWCIYQKPRFNIINSISSAVTGLRGLISFGIIPT